MNTDERNACASNRWEILARSPRASPGGIRGRGQDATDARKAHRYILPPTQGEPPGATRRRTARVQNWQMFTMNTSEHIQFRTILQTRHLTLISQKFKLHNNSCLNHAFSRHLQLTLLCIQTIPVAITSVKNP